MSPFFTPVRPKEASAPSEPRNHQKSDVLFSTTLLVILFLWITPHHEPWFDEAQAWLLARDSSLWDLLIHRLRYEGHPSLWYLFLRVPIGLGCPYSILGYLSASLAVMGGVIFFRHAPLPRRFRLLFPFSFFLFFQYGVVARSYSLLPALTFLLCRLHPDRFRFPWRYTVTLMLIAQVSVHSAIVAICWWLIYLREGKFPLRTFLAQRKTTQVKAAVAFAFGLLFLVVQLKPPADIVRPDFFDKDFSLFIKLIYTMWNGPLTEIWPVSLAIFVISCYWFFLRRMLAFYLFPTFVLLLFFGTLYGKAWHEGVVFLVWLAAVWVSFLPQDKRPINRQAAILMQGAMAVLLSVHLFWSWTSFQFDLKTPYSGAKGIADYLKEKKLDKASIIATQFFSPAILPYFDSNIFLNFNAGKRPSFFWWSLHYNFNDSPEFIMKQRPDLLILAIKFQTENKIPQFPGYQWVKLFPGLMFFKDRVIEKESFALFRREDSSPSDRER